MKKYYQNKQNELFKNPSQGVISRYKLVEITEEEFLAQLEINRSKRYGFVNEDGVLLYFQSGPSDGLIEIPLDAEVGQVRQEDGTFLSIFNDEAAKDEIVKLYDKAMVYLKSLYTKSDEDYDAFVLKFSVVDEYVAGGVRNLSDANAAMIKKLTNSQNVNAPDVSAKLDLLAAYVKEYKEKLGEIEFQRDGSILAIDQNDDNSGIIMNLRTTYNVVIFGISRTDNWIV